MISWQSGGIPKEKKEPNEPILEFLTNRPNEILLLLLVVVCHSHASKLMDFHFFAEMLFMLSGGFRFIIRRLCKLYRYAPSECSCVNTNLFRP